MQPVRVGAVVLLLAGWTVLPAVGKELDSGLVAGWRFDRIGAELPDLAGRGHFARLRGGRLVQDHGRTVLGLDGQQQILVRPGRELNLRAPFSIELRVRFDVVGDGHTVVFKDGQYTIRVDWTREGNRLSFFVFAGGQWEPRVSSVVPEPGQWYHLVATWDGQQAALWVNGEPFVTPRRRPPPAANDSPLVIASAAAHGAGIRGAIDYVKLYRRVLSPAEILGRAFGIGPSQSPSGLQRIRFEFREARDTLGWAGTAGTEVQRAGGQLVVRTGKEKGLAVHRQLAADLAACDYLVLRMAVDAGSRGEVVYVTTRGAGRVPLEVLADGKPHTYVLEAWTWPGWEGKLLALGLAPSELANARARIDYLRGEQQPVAEPDLKVLWVASEATLPRAGRAERIVARIRNEGGRSETVQALLEVPPGVVLESPAAQAVGPLDFQAETEVAWHVRAPEAGTCQLRVSLAGEAGTLCTAEIRFGAPLAQTKADYVPPPVPLDTGPYTLWTHYCPLWKEGTHFGWKLIEPWPERKPVLGWYNEGEPEVADWHIKMMREHGISGVIYCWYRTNRNAPVRQRLGHAIHDGLMRARYLPMIRFAIMWENGCGEGCGSSDDLLHNLLPFWIENYFSHPSYLRVEGKPLLYIWVPQNVTRDLGGSQQVRATFQQMRETCARRGLGGLYIVGCVGTQDQAALERMASEGWDATSAYGNSWRPPAQTRFTEGFFGAPVDGFIDQQQALWEFKLRHGRLPDIPSAMMGWDSRPWKETSFFWSNNTPERFRELCLRAKRALDAAPPSPVQKTLIFCCWNEFGEGHYIEPTRGYGYAYLDVIREVFGRSPGPHVDLAPDDVGLGPYDSWYAARRQAQPGQRVTAAWAGRALSAWSAIMGIADFQVADGVLRFRTDGNDPALVSPELKLRASRYRRLVIEMRTSRPSRAQVFWTTRTSPSPSQWASAHAAVRADVGFQNVVFEMGGNPSWTGCITGLRLDPASEEGVEVEIRSIRLE